MDAKPTNKILAEVKNMKNSSKPLFPQNRQPSGHIFGSVYNSVTSACFCKQKPSGNCPDNSIIA